MKRVVCASAGPLDMHRVDGEYQNTILWEYRIDEPADLNTDQGKNRTRMQRTRTVSRGIRSSFSAFFSLRAIERVYTLEWWNDPKAKSILLLRSEVKNTFSSHTHHRVINPGSIDWISLNMIIRHTFHASLTKWGTAKLGTQESNRSESRTSHSINE